MMVGVSESRYRCQRSECARTRGTSRNTHLVTTGRPASGENLRRVHCEFPPQHPSETTFHAPDGHWLPSAEVCHFLFLYGRQRMVLYS